MDFIQYTVADRVAVITLDRPDKANAQHRELLIELNAAFEQAAAADDVNVILLQANGRHFSAGHDLAYKWRKHAAASERGGDEAADERPWTLADHYRMESAYFLQYSLAWRDLPKPTIAAVQGKCVSAGLMLCWPCDLIIAAENAEFSDPTARMGLAGVEYMAHSWELGPRKAKELLLRSTALSADEAMGLGMVNKVVPLEDLHAEALEWARDIASLEPIIARLIKRSINSMQDAQGFSSSMQHGFDIHELVHGIADSLRAADPTTRPDDMLGRMRAANRAVTGE